jgi:hypothetical protein
MAADNPKEDEKGFVIRDRRGRGDEPPTPSASTASARTAQSRAQAEAHTRDAHVRDQGPPVNFSSFVFSLGTSALMLLGEKLDPQANVPVNLAQAKEIIDILSMLEAKTQGNLTTEEKEVLENTLYALRIKYVDLASKGSGRPL